MAPRLVLLFSGKRKSGKDHLAAHLHKLLGEQSQVLKISEPIKSHWAREKNLNLNELMGDGAYKEQYRLEMIQWSDEMRLHDYGCFCRIICQNTPDKPIWIVSDVRRKSDVRWFKENYNDAVQTIRITADVVTRQERGFEFTPGVDDVTSECDLDDYNDWDLIIDNGRHRQLLQEQLGSILGLMGHLSKRGSK